MENQNQQLLALVKDVSWPQYAMLKVHSATVEGGLEVTRVLAYNYTLVDSKEYGELHDFYQKVATADQQQIVLTRAPAAKAAAAVAVRTAAAAATPSVLLRIL